MPSNPQAVEQLNVSGELVPGLFRATPAPKLCRTSRSAAERVSAARYLRLLLLLVLFVHSTAEHNNCSSAVDLFLCALSLH